MARSLKFGWLSPVIGNKWSDYVPIAQYQDQNILPTALPHFDSLWIADHFYGFEGLREYKDKFDPVWSPKYLAARGGLALPRILADVTALIGRKH